MALLWAAGILWFAYDTANSQPKGDSNSVNAEQPADGADAPATPEQQQQFSDALNKF